MPKQPTTPIDANSESDFKLAILQKEIELFLHRYLKDNERASKELTDIFAIFYRILWELSERTGVGLHKVGISPSYVFGKAFGHNGKEVDSLGREL